MSNIVPKDFSLMNIETLPDNRINFLDVQFSEKSDVDRLRYFFQHIGGKITEEKKKMRRSLKYFRGFKRDVEKLERERPTWIKTIVKKETQARYHEKNFLEAESKAELFEKVRDTYRRKFLGKITHTFFFYIQVEKFNEERMEKHYSVYQKGERPLELKQRHFEYLNMIPAIERFIQIKDYGWMVNVITTHVNRHLGVKKFKEVSVSEKIISLIYHYTNQKISRGEKVEYKEVKNGIRHTAYEDKKLVFLTLHDFFVWLFSDVDFNDKRSYEERMSDYANFLLETSSGALENLKKPLKK